MVGGELFEGTRRPAKERGHGLRDVSRGFTPRDLAEDEMLFRVKCAGGILVLLSVPALEPELQGKSPEQVERMLVPVIAGALAGG